MLTELKWSTPEQRRNKASLTILHKIHNKKVNMPNSNSFNALASSRGGGTPGAFNGLCYGFFSIIDFFQTFMYDKNMLL